MAATFDLKKASNGRYSFNLKGSNGQILLTSGIYPSKAGAENGIASVRENAVKPSRYERRDNPAGQPYFVLKAINSQVIGVSEAYSSEAARENVLESVAVFAPGAQQVDLTNGSAALAGPF